MRFLSFWNKHEQRVGAWASIIGLLIVLIGLLSWPNTVKEAIYAAGLVLLLLGASAIFFVATVRLQRRARYAEAVGSAREATRKITTEDLAEFHSQEQKQLAL